MWQRAKNEEEDKHVPERLSTRNRKKFRKNLTLLADPHRVFGVSVDLVDDHYGSEG
jgi:hypothetical protein